MKTVFLLLALLVYLAIGFLVAYILYKNGYNDLVKNTVTNILLWPFVTIIVLIAGMLCYHDKLSTNISRIIKHVFDLMSKKRRSQK